MQAEDQQPRPPRRSIARCGALWPMARSNSLSRSRRECWGWTRPGSARPGGARAGTVTTGAFGGSARIRGRPGSSTSPAGRFHPTGHYPAASSAPSRPPRSTPHRSRGDPLRQRSPSAVWCAGGARRPGDAGPGSRSPCWCRIEPGAPASSAAWSISARSAPAPPGDHPGLASTTKQQVSGCEPTFGHPQARPWRCGSARQPR
jgi:hypothetical protein